MQPHQQRVIDEKQELDGKLAKLNIFLGDPVFEGLPLKDQELLKQQSGVMQAYSNILANRIARF